MNAALSVTYATPKAAGEHPVMVEKHLANVEPRVQIWRGESQLTEGQQANDSRA